MSHVVFGAFGKSGQFWLSRNNANGVCCLLAERGIFVGAYAIRPLPRRPSRAANRKDAETAGKTAGTETVPAG